MDSGVANNLPHVDGVVRDRPTRDATVGTDQWSYEWQVPDGSGTTTILSRASDDSVNLETPGEDVTVTYGRPAAAR